MNLIVLILLSCFTGELQSISAGCSYHNFNKYDCNIGGAIHTDDKAYFDVDAKYRGLHVEKLVYKLAALDSVLYYVPMQIFAVFPSLEELLIEGAQLKELRPLQNCDNLEIIKLNHNELKSIGRVFEACRKLREIYMENNQIVSIDSDAFKRMTSLKSLFMPRNQIEEIREETFEDLAALQHLELSRNRISKIDAGVFRKLGNVRTIELYNNEIEFFADGLFVNLNSLERLLLDFNNFSTLKLASFGDLPNLLQLHIGESRLNSMSSELIKKFPRLNYLLAINTPCVNKEFRDFDISLITEDLQACFEKVLTCINQSEDSCAITGGNLVADEKYVTIDGTGYFGSIRNVHASNSILEFVPQIIFNEFTQLSRVELKNVRMKNLRRLKNCLSLTHLNLDDNNLIELPEKVFDECQSLTEISLMDNAILSIQDNAFKGLKLLQSLYISNAAYKMTPSEDAVQIHPNTFEQQAMLTSLQLSFKNSLDLGSSIEKLTNLRTLRLDNNEMTAISDEAFKPFVNLQLLDLNTNRISEIHENAFKFLISLSTLDLSYNFLTQLHQNIFLNTFNLVVVTLDGNHFETLPAVFEKTQNLAELNLNVNKLKSLSSSAQLHQIRKLSFRDNKISWIAKSFITSTPNLNELSLAGNECIQKDFKDFSVFDQDFISELKTCIENFVAETFCVFSYSKFGYSCSMKMDQDTNENILESGRDHLANRTDDDVQYLHSDTPLVSMGLPKIFEKFQRLERVQLKNPSIERIETIEHCEELRYFDVRLNKLSQLPAGVFMSCERIESLILIKNQISTITTIEATTLTQLNLSFNELSSIPDGFFNSLGELKSLVLSHNNLDVFSWVIYVKRLTVLDLSHNKIKSVSFDVFHFQDDLIELHLNNNDISTITQTTQFILQRLQYLNLANNSLVAFELAAVILKSLQYLDISNNKIVSIDFIQEEENHLTNFFADGNVCIDKSFENIENFDEVLLKGHDCFLNLE